MTQEEKELCKHILDNYNFEKHFTNKICPFKIVELVDNSINTAFTALIVEVYLKNFLLTQKEKENDDKDIIQIIIDIYYIETTKLTKKASEAHNNLYDYIGTNSKYNINEIYRSAVIRNINIINTYFSVFKSILKKSSNPEKLNNDCSILLKYYCRHFINHLV